jgi:V8-like Glu-specific endopeptidase
MPDPVQGGEATRYLRKLSYGVPGARTETVEASTAEALSAEHAEWALEQAIRTIERETGAALPAQSRAELERLFLQDGKRAIERLKKEGVSARLPPAEVDALEAIVEVDGSRPTLALSADDEVDVEDQALGPWRSVVKKFVRQISAAAVSVGRIDLDGTHVGTGFVVKEGLILTNRHVLQGLARQENSGAWTFRGQPTITFDANPKQSRARQFEIRKKVVLAGPDPIDLLRSDYNKLDFAVLECAPSAGTPAFPAPLPLESDADKIVVGRPIFTLGYPARPKYDRYGGDVLSRLFQRRYGVKRFAPGEIDRGLGSAAERTGEAVFTHDSTTLAGNSGSCVVDLGNDGRLVVGLHFAGSAKEANYAHSNARLRAKLAELGLTWMEWMRTA